MSRCRHGFEEIGARGRCPACEIEEERDQLRDQLAAARRDLAEERRQCVHQSLIAAHEVRQQLAEVQAQLATERQGALAREEMLEEVRLVAREYRARWIGNADYDAGNDAQDVAEHPWLKEGEA
jgi:hypothetical protein